MQEDRDVKVHAAASRAADRYTEERAKSTALAARKEYAAHAAVPQRVKDAFEAFDADRSGYLDYRELRNALRLYGFDTTAFEAASILAAYDADPDGQLDLIEFAKLVRDAEDGTVQSMPGMSAARAAAEVARREAEAAVPRRVRAAFDAFDRDRSGTLDPRELRRALHFYGADVSTEVAASVLAAYDANPDGRLDVNEFARLVADVEAGGAWASAPSMRGSLAPQRMSRFAVPSRVRAAFEAFDHDKSGALDVRELRHALKFYGIQGLSARGVSDVLHAYDDRPDGKLDLAEFASLVADVERGFVLTAEQQRPQSASFATRRPLSGLGSAPNGSAGQASAAWPHHRQEEKRLEAVRDELGRNDGVRAQLLKNNKFWSGKDGSNGEWVRNQLIAEQESRFEAEQDAKIARAEAAAAVARVEALRAASAARELEIEAAAARIERVKSKEDKAAAEGPKLVDGKLVGAARAGDVSKERMSQLVTRLECALLDKLDERAQSDSESARAAVLKKVFRSAPIGGPRSGRFATRAELRDAMALLGLPQPLTSVEHVGAQDRLVKLSLGEKDGKGPPAAGGEEQQPPPRLGMRPQKVVEGHAWIDVAVVDAFFDKHAEKPPATSLKPPSERVIDFDGLYLKVSRSAVRPGHGPALGKTQQAYLAKLGKGGGSIFDERRTRLQHDRWAAGRQQVEPAPTRMGY